MLRRLRQAWSAGLLLAVTSCSLQPAVAQIPTQALKHRAEVVRTARALGGMDAPVSLFAGQFHQESRWQTDARSPVGALGMAQFMPTTSAWIAELYPDLSANAPYNPGWAIRALITYDLWLYDRIRAASACERWAFALSAYNGGLGWVNRDKKLASSKGLDPLVWFGSVDQVNAGRSAANWRENRHYPLTIIRRHQPLYVHAGWGQGVCE